VERPGKREMPKKRQEGIQWLRDVAKHDYIAAASFLGLLHGDEGVRKLMKRLRKARVVEFRAKDIFRASQLSLLGATNAHVESDRIRIREGKGLSPVLLVRDEPNGKVVIADGYHRLCAIYQFDEDSVIRCKII
jgi:hypothetical protein